MKTNDAGEDQSSLGGTLKTRGSRYGEFRDNADVTDRLMAIILQADADSIHMMDYVQREALHIICQKISRICNGDPNYNDNWHDIAGYATLIDDYLNKPKVDAHTMETFGECPVCPEAPNGYFDSKYLSYHGFIKS